MEFLPTCGKLYHLKIMFLLLFWFTKIFPDSSEDIIIQVLHWYERAYAHFGNKNKKKSREQTLDKSCQEGISICEIISTNSIRTIWRGSLVDGALWVMLSPRGVFSTRLPYLSIICITMNLNCGGILACFITQYKYLCCSAFIEPNLIWSGKL